MNGDGAEAGLRQAAEVLCDQLCEIAAGNLEIRLSVDTDDVTAQKLAMLSNAVLHVARRAVADTEFSRRELARAHEIARLGTWRIELTAGVQSWSWSPELHRLFGTDPARFTPAVAAYDAIIHPGDRAHVAAAHARALAGLPESYEWRAVCPDGIERRILTELCPELVGDKAIALRGVCQDITERHAAEARIRYLAEHDGLTGLANRVVLHDRLGKALASRRQRPGADNKVALLYLDLDGFKAVNDHHGHAAGDRVLAQAAARMASLIRGEDTLARLGGDEFAILQVAHEQPAAAEALSRRLVTALAKPYGIGDGVEVQAVSGSIGIAIAPRDGDQVDSLLAAADVALYQAKANGRNGAAFYDAEMERKSRERRDLEADLRQAVPRGELSVLYQPLVDVRTRAVIGYEALLRWRHPERGPIPPDVFIPMAEAAGAIGSIGEWVLERACAEAAGWSMPRFVAVNVSPIQVQRGFAFAEMVERVLARTGLAPDRLELEVTEGVLIREASAALEALGRVRALGVRVALDDFGTGYSSLATLQAFPFDKIKVDRRFVAGLGTNSRQDTTIVRAVLGLARGLGVPVVAEGVETEVQLAALRLENCAEAQGWLFGKPEPIPLELRQNAAA